MSCIPFDKCAKACPSSSGKYWTMFQDHSINDNCSKLDSRKMNAFIAKDPCLKCVCKNSEKAKIINNTLNVRFSPEVGSSNAFWIRLGANAGSSCHPVDSCIDSSSCMNDNTCCPSIGNIGKGYLDFWIFFPAEDVSMQNLCNFNAKTKLPRTSPFYHGGKLLGICSSQCPTGNSSSDKRYNTDWTIRLMFREQGRLALLYSVPLGSFPLEPVPDPIRSYCCPGGDCSKLSSASTDQYWFATKNKSFHKYRLGEYAFNPTNDIDCCTQYKWPDGSDNPIDQIFQYNKWNFLRVKWDVENGMVQVYHASDHSSDESTAPSYTPSTLDVVIDTPPKTIPFVSAQPAKSFYFQPFFGGSENDWIPTSVDKVCTRLSDQTPVFTFGDVHIYSET